MQKKHFDTACKNYFFAQALCCELWKKHPST